MQKLVKCIYKSSKDLVKHNGIEIAGYLSFLTILSIFPGAILLVRLLNFTLHLIKSNSKIQQIAEILFYDNELLDIISTIKPRMDEILSNPPQGIIGFAIFGMLWTSSSFVETFRVSLNKSYRVKNPPGYIVRRVTSMLQFLFMISSITIAVVVMYFMQFFVYQKNLESVEFLVRGNIVLQNMLGMLIVFISIIWLYTVIPDKKQYIVDTVPGAFFVVVLIYISIKVFKVYMRGFSQLGLVYGSMQGTIITLLFFYAINLFMIFGAEFNYNFHKIYKKKYSFRDTI